MQEPERERGKTVTLTQPGSKPTAAPAASQALCTHQVKPESRSSVWAQRCLQKPLGHGAQHQDCQEQQGHEEAHQPQEAGLAAGTPVIHVALPGQEG